MFMNILDIPWIPNPDSKEIRRNTVKAILRILSWDDILSEQKDRLLKHVLLWDLTELVEINAKGKHGKYKQLSRKYNLRYWSKEAINDYDVNAPKRESLLRHEHVLSRKTTYAFLKREDISDEIKISLLSNPSNVPSCVVSIRESKVLNKIKNLKGWDRYIKANISVYDRSNKEFIDPKLLQKEIDELLLETE